jgi:hypothetical protein
MIKRGTAVVEPNTDMQPHFTYARLVDSRDSVNNPIRASAAASNSAGQSRESHIKGEPR